MRSKEKKTTALPDEKISKKTKSDESRNSNIAPQSKNTITTSPRSRNIGVKRKQKESTNTINISAQSTELKEIQNKSFAASEKISLNMDTQSTDNRRPKRKKDKSIDVKQCTPSSSFSSSTNACASSSSSSSSFSNEIVTEKILKNVISSNMFTSNTEAPFSQLGLEEHANEIRHLFRTIFGLNKTSISAGLTITTS